ncbi:MAG: hypothetical protein K9L65_17715 [Chromatiaceae bacterium]|nr:hypothetical protein [Chromatiaceae bacterium]
MEDVIARLRASKIEWMEQSSENYDDGLASGREWAANIASYDDLYLLTMQLTMNVGEEHLENAPTGSAKRLALEVSVKDPEKIGELDLDAIAEQFWQPFGGLAAVDARGSAWLDAFEEGAKRLFDEIEDKL